VDPVKMLANWQVKLIPTRVQEDFTARLPSMTNRFTNWAVYQSNIIAEVKALLGNGSGANVIQVQWYCAFAMELASLQAKHKGTVLVDEAALRLAKWKARGLTEVTLISIRNIVFGIAAPAAP
jgi:hypothetical protein